MRIRFISGAVLGVVCVALSGCTYLNGNFREVEPGAVYRSGQLSDRGLERQMERHGIRTVISFREPDPHDAWYAEELAVCERLEAKHVSIPWSKEKLPAPDSLAQYLDTLAGAHGPALVHCEGGVHRSGVASASWILARGGSVEEARLQLGLFFNNAPIGILLDLYERSGYTDFRAWVTEAYPDAYAHAPETLR